MHVKPLEGRVETLRDFIRNYAMFVASILTALALEQAGVTWHDHRAASAATIEIEAEVIATVIQPAVKRFGVGLAFPTLQREAWERAVVNPSAAHIEAARLGRFSTAHAAQRDIGQLAFQGMSMLLSGTRLIDAINDAEPGLRVVTMQARGWGAPKCSGPAHLVKSEVRARA
jgi:hypothetical protein